MKSGRYCIVYPPGLHLKAVMPRKDIHLSAEKLIPTLVNAEARMFPL